MDKLIVSDMTIEMFRKPDWLEIRDRFLLMKFNCNYRQEIRRSNLDIVESLPAITQSQQSFKANRTDLQSFPYPAMNHCHSTAVLPPKELSHRGPPALDRPQLNDRSPLCEVTTFFCSASLVLWGEIKMIINLKRTN